VDRGRVFYDNRMLTLGHGLIETGYNISGGVFTGEGCFVVIKY
jgi:hypothetical protein